MKPDRRRGMLHRSALVIAMLIGGGIAVGGACGLSPGSESEDRDPGSSPSAPGVPEPGAHAIPGTRLPQDVHPFSPSLVQLVENDPADVQRLADVDACAECHEDAARQWRASAHAQASFNNPYYRAVIDEFRAQAGREASRFCAGCHEPTLLLQGKMDEPIEPTDPLAHAGVTCLVCHGTRQARPDGNGSYTLSTAPVPYPDPADPESIEAHRRRVAPDVLRSAALCGSCHRSFLGPTMGAAHHLPGIDDIGSWRRSAYAGSHATLLDEPVAERRCQDCHMQPERAPLGDMAAERGPKQAHGTLASHRFAGGHETLATLLGDAAQRQAVRARLATAATIDVAAARSEQHGWTRPADGAPAEAGDTLWLDVVVRNVGAGHKMPGGTRDIQDTWVAVGITDADGQPVAHAGLRHAEGRRDDPTAFRLRAAPLDEDGRIETTHVVHRFRAVAFDHTIAPRDAAVVRYRFEVPAGLPDSAFPLQVEARLLRRRHGRPMHELACRATRSARGRAFARAARKLGRPVLNGCAEQPITQMARSAVWVGPGAAGHDSEGGARRARWKRLFEHGLGLAGGLQERLDEARPSIEAALAELDRAEGGDRERAMVIALAARICARQGRLDEARQWLDRAEAYVGPHPALARIRGEAYARLWRWPRAAEAFGPATEAAPKDDATWRWLARAAGSAGRDREALAAAQKGLQWSPRDGALLRSQALALERLHASGASRARDAFLDHRVPDALPALRSACARNEPHCDRDRQPIPEIRLRPVRRGD